MGIRIETYQSKKTPSYKRSDTGKLISSAREGSSSSCPKTTCHMNSKKKQWDKRCPAYFSYDGPIRSWSVQALASAFGAWNTVVSIWGWTEISYKQIDERRLNYCH